jgi:hypothetical protein
VRGGAVAGATSMRDIRVLVVALICHDSLVSEMPDGARSKDGGYTSKAGRVKGLWLLVVVGIQVSGGHSG